MSPKFRVFTEKHPEGRITDAENESRASQRTPGKTLSVEPVGASGPVDVEAVEVAVAERLGDDGFFTMTGGQITGRHVPKTPASAVPVGKRDPIEEATAVLSMPALNPDGKVIVPKPPTEKQLKRHAQLFDGKKKVKKQKGAPIKAQVFALIDKGHDWEEVGDVFNLKPAKEKELRNEYLARQAKEEA